MNEIFRTKNGITLIALIVTIIILLILAGVSISLLGDNGLFTKAQQAKKEQAEAEVKEKINMLVSEYAIDREQGKSLSQFLIEKKDNGEIEDFIDNNDGTFDIIINGYTATINESDLSTTEPQILSDIMVTCLAKAFANNKIQALITVKSQSGGIKQIKLINNVTVQGNNKSSITFDHPIAANIEYQVEVELTNGTTSTKTIKYEDTEAPTATIEITKKIIFNEGKIQANVSIEDNRSGVNVGTCKWVVLQNSENLGTTDESLYTGGTLSSTTQTIETDTITEPGEYYIHLLLKDNVGNITEGISEKIEIKEGYEISTPEELQAMRTDLTGNYYVTKDIDMTGFEFTPIEGNFTGTIDGQRHTITGLTITNPIIVGSSNYSGIFLRMSNATIKNIIFKDIDISGGVKSTLFTECSDNVGDKNVFSKVGITGQISASEYASTFQGTTWGRTVEFENCYSRVNYTGTGKFYGFTYGDLPDGAISIKNSYYAGTVSGNATNYYPFISNYGNWQNLSDIFYNKSIFTPQVEKYTGTGLTTDQFADSSNFTNWDFTNDWYIDEDGYPELKF